MNLNLRRISLLFVSIFMYTIAFTQCENLVWQDEFDGTSLDLSKWGYETGDGCPELCQWGTGQLDYATDREENVKVEGGKLYLTIRKEDDPSQFNGREYTSGRIRTYQKVNFKYGRIEAKLKGVYSQGLGFAFWTLGSDYETTIWPKCGEIDIFEQTGKHPDYNIGTTHFEEAWGHAMNQGNVTLPDGERFADDFYVVGLIWTPDSMSWYLNDPSNIYHTFYYSDGINNYDPFNRDQFLILSVGMGGDYSGGPDETTVLPQSAVVEYVKVWEGPFSVELSGSKKLYENTTATYNITEVTGANYNWTVPAGATIVSGQGTSSIEVQWGGPESSGDVICDVVACSSNTYSRSVVVEPALIVDNIFEDAEANHNVNYSVFSGSLEEAVSNPAPNSVNSSSVVVRHGRDGGTEWDYVVMSDFNPGHAGRYVQGINRLFIDVYTDAPVGSKITLGFENSLVAVPEAVYGKHSNYEAFTTTQNQWETLEFILTGVPDKYTGSYNVDKAVLMFEPGTVSSNTYYFDNFRSGIAGGEAPILDTQVLEDWNGNSNISLIASTGNFEANYANPNPSGINTSGNVLKYTRNASTEYDEFSFNIAFDDASKFKEGVNTISFDIYTGAEAGKVISMHMIDTTQATVTWESQIHSIYETKVTKQNEWERVTFYWASTPNAAVPNVNVNKFLFKIDEKFTTGDVYYIDNIVVNSTEVPASYVLDDIIEDYEDNRFLTHIYSADSYEQAIANPASNEVNSSELVGKYQRGAENDWLVFNIDKQIDANGLREKSKVFALDVYTDAPAGTLITLGLEAGTLANSDNWPTGRHSDYATAVKIQNEWQTVKFIFSSSADGSTPSALVDKLIITANQGNPSPYSFYFDNLRILAEISDTVLNRIEVSPSLVENVQLNQSIDFNETGFDQFDALFETNVTWSVNGGGTIDPQTGVFTATQNGVWTVTAQDGSIRGTANVLVGQGIQLDKITVSPSSSKIYETEQIQLSAHGVDQLGRVFELNNLTWSSNNPQIASVDQDGLVTSYIPGNVTITAQQDNVSNTSSIEVRETPRLNSIDINPKTNQIYTNQTLQFSAVTLDQYNQSISVPVEWSVSSGSIDNGLFTPSSIGTVSVTVSSGDFAASTYVTALEPSVNLALNKLPEVSTSQAGTDPATVTDGDASTKWSSEWSDAEWIYVDLGAEYDLTSVVLNWEAAYGKVYNVQLSHDGVSWSTVYTETAGNGGFDVIELNYNTARYVKIEGVERGTVYGYSLWEMEVYGIGHQAAALTSIYVAPGKTTVSQNDVINYIATGFDQFGNQMGLNPSWTATGGNMQNGRYTATQAGNFEVSASQDGITGKASVSVSAIEVPYLAELYISPSEVTVDVDEVVNFSLTAIDQFGNNYPIGSVNWTSTCGNIENGVYTATTAGTTCSVSAEVEGIPATATVTVNSGNCGLVSTGKYAESSSQEGGYSAANAFDGDLNTRWGSNFNDDEWLMVDLGTVQSICEVKLYWEGAYGSDYEIRLGTSNEINAAQTIATVVDGDGGEDVVVTDNSVSGQYLFMKGSARGTGWGYSLWEMEVYGSASDNNPVDDNIAALKPVTSSSTQGGLTLEAVNDKDLGTRWGSEWNDDEWLQIDLQNEYSLTNVVIEWEGAYGKDYEIQLSNDEAFSTYNVIASVVNGDGGNDNISTDASVSGRFLRLKGIARGTGYGYSIWELEAYGNVLKSAKAENSSVKLDASFEVNCYPNPVSDILNVKVIGADDILSKLSIKDLSGRLVLQRNIKSNESIDISNLKQGVYILSITNSNFIKHKKVIKK